MTFRGATIATMKTKTVRRRRTCRAIRPESDRLLELRHEFEEIADEAEIGNLEDRRLGVLVDRDDCAGVLDAGEVLDRAGNADRDVELRRDDLAGLADL